MMHGSSAVLLLLSILSLINASSIQFDIARKNEKCLSDDITKGSLAILHYNVMSSASPNANTKASSVSMLIKDPSGKYLKEDHNIDLSTSSIHTFTFTASLDGAYTVCFYNNNDKPQRILLELKHGVEAKDYSEVAKKEHLAPVEQELRKLEDTVDEIHREMLYMREREAAMRNTNESTNSRVLWFSFFSIVVLLGMGAWQVIYLKKFFRSKKLI